MTKHLIVNADDYGLTPAVSRGIVDGFLNGIITSTTVMMSGHSVTEDLELLTRQCPEIGIGVHLTLTSLRPLSNIGEIPTLIKETGEFWSLKELNKYCTALDAEELYREWKKQVTALLDLGVTVDHLDSHHHVSYLTTDTVDITGKLALEFNLPVRTPVSPFDNAEIVCYARERFQELGVLFPENFIPELTKSGGELQTLENAIIHLPEGITEMLTHAGYVDDTLRALSSLTDTREKELMSLKTQSLKQLIQSKGIELSSFGSVYRK